MSDSIAKKLGAIIAPIEGGMPERLLADPDVQAKLLFENARLRAALATERERGWNAHAANLSLSEENTKLREALVPFAGLRVGRFMTNGLTYSWRIDVAHVRRAHAALNETKETGDE